MATGYRGTRLVRFGEGAPKAIRLFTRRVWHALVDDLREARPLETTYQTCRYCGTSWGTARALGTGTLCPNPGGRLFRYARRVYICATCRTAILTADEVRS